MTGAFVFALLICGISSVAHAATEVGDSPTNGVAIRYQLPTTGPLPHTYRVTLAITATNNPDWIVSTFVAGAARTVTKQNRGVFTDYWDGLDENFMPVPPGAYGVKGIFMPSREWKMDGQPHSLIPRYVAAAGDSWSPTREHDDKFPWIFGHVFSGLRDVQVGTNGHAGVLFNYIENAWNPFLADFNRPVGHDQVLKRFDSGGIGGGNTVACDGENVWLVGSVGDPFIHRAGGGWGTDKNMYGVQGVKLPAVSPSMAVGRYLYVALPESVLILDKAKATPVAEVKIHGPQAITLDTVGHRLLALCNNDVRVVSLKDGLPEGEWQTLFTVEGQPTDLEIYGSSFFVCDPTANQVYQLDAQGKVLRRFGRSPKQKPGQYDALSLMTPKRLATWTDVAGHGRLLVIEEGGPGRLSEWNVEDGSLMREWFFPQPGAFGYCLDPEEPEHVYTPAIGGSGLVRFRVNYKTGEWKPDAVWPDICRGAEFPAGGAAPRIYRVHGHKYLTMSNWYMSGRGNQMVYRFAGKNIVPSAGVITKTGTERYWWHDANGDGQVQEAEFTGPVKKLAGVYWGDDWLDDLSLANFDTPGGVWQRLPPGGFDKHANPIYEEQNWQPFVHDPVYAAWREKRVLDALHGGNEIPTTGVNWIHLDGNKRDGFYVADSFGPANPGGVDTAGGYFSQSKLSRYRPDGHGGYSLKWRVGRKAFRLRQPGEIYSTHYFRGPTYGLVGIFDSNGLYHLFTEDGLFVDTLMLSSSPPHGGMYTFSGESWYGAHALNRKDGKVYLFMGRSACNVYEVEGWTKKLVKSLKVLDKQVNLNSGQISWPHPIALALRGGPGTAKVASFYPAPGSGPAIDGSLAGWEAVPPVQFQLDPQRQVEVRGLYDLQTLYLRWHVRLPQPFQPVELGDTTRLFTHARAADFVSFYLQGDRNAPPGHEDGRPGDMRIVFAIVKDGSPVKPIALGMFASATPPATNNPATYISPTGKTQFAHVDLLADARLAYTIDADRQGFVIAAAIPTASLPIQGRLEEGFRTTGDFACTLGGKVNFWWANVGNLPNTYTTDEPSEARLYPGSWAPVQFEGLREFTIRDWLVCGPWGGEKLKERPVEPHPQDNANNFTRQFFRTAQYPPDGGHVDPTAVYTGPLTQDITGQPHEVRWQTVHTTGNFVEPFKGLELGFAATWVYAPEDCELKADFLCNDFGTFTLVWLNDIALNSDADAAGMGIKGFSQKPITLHKGWNKFFVRGFSLWPAVKLGVVLHGPEELLWKLKVSASPPVP